MKTIAGISPISIITIFYFFSISSFALSQNRNANCSNTVIDSSIFEDNLAGEFYVHTGSNQGSVYYNTDWRLGTILLENNKKVTNKYLNYHLLNNQLFWIRIPDYKQIILKKETIKEIEIYPKGDEKREVFRKIKFRPWYRLDSISEYLQVLSEGQINLYAFRKAEQNISTNEIIPSNEYYIQINQKEIKHLKRGRWALYATVGDNKILIKKVVRSNHLRIRKEYDLIKAIDLFNQEVKKATK
jgi:hypothetical protein